MAHCKPPSASFGNGVDSDTMLACAPEWMPKLEDIPKPALPTFDPLRSCDQSATCAHAGYGAKLNYTGTCPTQSV